MSWTDLKVSKLKELWTKGHTASEIAGMLGETTRNAVIGKAHRLNLEERAPSKAKSGSEKKQINNIKIQLSTEISKQEFIPEVLPSLLKIYIEYRISAVSIKSKFDKNNYEN